MSTSNFFGPGAYALVNGTTIQVTSDVLKPSFSATAYATADSKPLPLVGSSSMNQGGYAGLSVPTVKVPDVTSSSWSLAQGSALGLPLAVPLAEDAGGAASSGAQAAARARTDTAATQIRVARDMGQP